MLRGHRDGHHGTSYLKLVCRCRRTSITITHLYNKVKYGFFARQAVSQLGRYSNSIILDKPPDNPIDDE